MSAIRFLVKNLTITSCILVLYVMVPRLVFMDQTDLDHGLIGNAKPTQDQLQFFSGLVIIEHG